MPDLTKQEAAAFDFARVEKEIDQRMDEVARITEGVESWDQIPEDREGRDRLPKMMQELNLLGARRDEIQEAKGHQDQYVALKQVLNEPEKFIDAGTGKTRKGDLTSMAFAKGGLVDKLKAGQRGNELAAFPLGALGLKATVGIDTTGAGVDTAWGIEPHYVPGVVEELFQQPNISDLIPTFPTTKETIQYLVENYTDAAAEVAEGSAAAEASIAAAFSTETVQKIAVGIKATTEVLGDSNLLRGLVQTRLRQDILRREDLQLLVGDGTGDNLSGIMDRAIGSQNASLAAGDIAFLEAIFQASTTIRENFLNPAVVVINNNSWETFRLLRDDSGGAGTGQYMFGPPSVAVEPRLWGLRVVLNENMDDHSGAGTTFPALVGDFANSAMIFRNPNVAVGVTDSDASDFLADVLTFKASMREALLVHRLGGFAEIATVA